MRTSIVSNSGEAISLDKSHLVLIFLSFALYAMPAVVHLNFVVFFISTSTLYFIVCYMDFMVSIIWVDSTPSKSNLGIFQLKHIYSKTINKYICVCSIECYRWSRKTVLLLWIKNRTNMVVFIPDTFGFLCRSNLLLFLMVFSYNDCLRFFSPFRPLHKHV